jgi:UDP-N-acetylmuramate: L-alanyl-gamma-D-glutamyl-meso-diaminopimelate ligase
MAICGTGMGSLAGLLKARGYDVCGSDNNVYPPMSTELAKQGISVFTPYHADNLKKTKPDLVIVGNAVSLNHVEAQFLMASKIPYVSMPQALNHFFLKNRDVIVVSGTHGKTTTTGLMAHLLNELGTSPSFLVGGVAQGFSSSFQIGDGKIFVIEGDEYDTAFFDKGPKFLHYHPKHVIMTSLEFDHADIYRDLNHVTESFIKLAKIIPENGSLHLCASYPSLKSVLPHLNKKITPRWYGETSLDWQIRHFQAHPAGSTFEIWQKNQKRLSLQSPLTGIYNAENVAACFSVLDILGYDLNLAAKALTHFQGIKRRQEVIFKNQDFVVIDDFAHHPTAVKETIIAIHQKFPHHHLVAVFEPRSNTSKRDIFQKEYSEAFGFADESILSDVFMPEKVPNGLILDVEKIVCDLKKNHKIAHHMANTNQIIEHIAQTAQKPTAVLIMSNGNFDDIHKRLIQRLST